MKINKNLEKYIMSENKKYNDFLNKNTELIKNAEETLKLFLKNFYEKDKKYFLEVFKKDFENIDNLLFKKLFPSDFINKKTFNLNIRKFDNKEEFYLFYNNLYSEFEDFIYFKYKIYIDKNWNFLKKDELILS